jgi:hypothetical protein
MDGTTSGSTESEKIVNTVIQLSCGRPDAAQKKIRWFSKFFSRSSSPERAERGETRSQVEIILVLH